MSVEQSEPGVSKPAVVSTRPSGVLEQPADKPLSGDLDDSKAVGTTKEPRSITLSPATIQDCEVFEPTSKASNSPEGSPERREQARCIGGGRGGDSSRCFFPVGKRTQGTRNGSNHRQ